MIEIKRLIWSDWNIEHIARHAVIPAEVEAACHITAYTASRKLQAVYQQYKKGGESE